MLGLLSLAMADDFSWSLHGNVKTFFGVDVPYRWIDLSDGAYQKLDALGVSEEDARSSYGFNQAPIATANASTRLMAAFSYRMLRLELHWAFLAGTSSPTSLIGSSQKTPELLPLSSSEKFGSFHYQQRVDRLLLSLKIPHLDLAIGRQPTSFGVGRFFAPLDLVNPFGPSAIDTEYKPGIDAVRADVYMGMTTQVSVVAAKAEREILAGTARTTVGITDLLGFIGDIRGEGVLGMGLESSIGPVGVHGEVSFTGTSDPFLRAVVGADGRPTEKTGLSGEVYVQSWGASEAEGYWEKWRSERLERGEMWQVGRWYGALALNQEITPLLQANISVISNVGDPSALLSGGISWSAAENVEVALGAYGGLGKRPKTLFLDLDPFTFTPVPPSDAAMGASIRSEFGVYPTLVWLQMRVYD